MIFGFKFPLDLSHYQPRITEDFNGFPLSFLTESRSVMKASYSTSLFVAEKSNLKDFSMVMCSGEIMTTLIPEPLWLAAPSTYNSHCGRGDATTAITPLDSLSWSSLSPFSTLSMNSATRSAETCPFGLSKGDIWCQNLVVWSPTLPLS